MAKVSSSTKLVRFEAEVIPHLDAAHNLARWITKNGEDAEDVVQERTCLRAYRYFDGYHGGSVKAWLLTIVRNTCYTWLQQNRKRPVDIISDDELNAFESADASPETVLLAGIDKDLLHKAMDALPAEYREILILREMEELSYKEIADIAELPVGTVMSRLSRARKRLQQLLTGDESKEVGNG